ncbi:MAG: HEAT repeat domain-containing protein [Myxococcota bacterium]
MRTLTVCTTLLGMALGLTGCFEQEEPTCEYWVPKLTSAQRSDKALDMVEELKCTEAVPTLEKLFEEGQYRDRILRVLKQIGDKDAAAPLIRSALLTRDTGKLAASIVKDWELEAARPELEQILTGTALPKHRKEALESLLAFEQPSEIEDLLIELAGADPNVQGILVNKRAVELLGNIQSEKAIPTLVQAAFMRDNKGVMIYQAARVALAKVGPERVPLLIETIHGDNEDLKTYARDNGIPDWEWQSGPEIVQLLTDTLQPEVGKPVVENMARELQAPLGVSDAMKERWRTDQLNRLKVAMLGLGHVGPEEAVEDLAAIVKDPLADAVNQRLHSATAMALIGTPDAVETLLTIFEEEDDARFRAPLLRPLSMAVDADHLERFDELTEDAEGLLEESLEDEQVATYLAVLRECKDDTGCWVKKLDSDDKHEVVKAAVTLARANGSLEPIRAALIKRFAETPTDQIDIRRFTLVALTRIGGEAQGDELIKIAENAPADDTYWPAELTVFGWSLKHGANKGE